MTKHRNTKFNIHKDNINARNIKFDDELYGIFCKAYYAFDNPTEKTIHPEYGYTIKTMKTKNRTFHVFSIDSSIPNIVIGLANVIRMMKDYDLKILVKEYELKHPKNDNRN